MVTKRDSRDAWAGIVDFDDEAPVTSKTNNGPSKSLLDAQVSTDVDALPKDALDFSSERMQTEEHGRPDEAPKPLSLRTKPITEKSSTSVTQAEASDSLPEPPPLSNSSPAISIEDFTPNEPLSDLNSIQPSSWDPKVNFSWSEYRTVIAILSGGIIALGLIFFLRDSGNEVRTSSSADSLTIPEKLPSNKRLERIKKARAGQITVPKPSAQEAAEPKTQTPEPAPEAPVVNQAPTPPQPSEPTPAKPAEPAVLPMLSILSVPPGAMVEIEGEVYGKTPLIRASPKQKGPLEIKLRYKHHKTKEMVVWPNKSGHYEAQIILEPN